MAEDEEEGGEQEEDIRNFLLNIKQILNVVGNYSLGILVTSVLSMILQNY